MVKAGKLPPVEQRVSQEPMVVKPLNEIGKYGGTWRRAFTGPGDGENGNRINSTDKILFWDYTGNKIIPSLAKGYELSADGTSCKVLLRKGARWSDGEPFNCGRLHVLVPGHLPEQGPPPGRDARILDQRQTRYAQ